MGVTRLKRKGKKNKAKSATRNFSLKHLTKVPVIKNVDIEELKKEFGAAAKKETKKAEATPAPAPKAVEAKVAEEAPVAEEVKEKPAKKAAAKKEEATEEKAEKAPKAKAAKKDKEDTAE